MRPAPLELQAFWRELPNAKLIHGGRVLQLASNTSFLGVEGFGKQLLVRDCYVRLWDKLDDTLLSRPLGFGRIIIGTPGEVS